MSKSTESALEFWNKTYLSKSHTDSTEPVLQAALAHFGDVRGKRLLDVGCGPGEASIWFAAQGADVTGIDISDVGVQTLRALCAQNGIENVRAEVCSAMDIEKLGPFDFVFGSMILHHIEPFADFASALGRATAPGGKGFFYENSSRSGVLIWFRTHLVGKFGIPKYGDEEEFPLQPKEIDMLKRDFDVKVEFPELLYFRLVSTYLFRNKLLGLTGAMDRWFYKRKFLNRYSYRQYVMLTKRTEA